MSRRKCISQSNGYVYRREPGHASRRMHRRTNIDVRTDMGKDGQRLRGLVVEGRQDGYAKTKLAASHTYWMPTSAGHATSATWAHGYTPVYTHVYTPTVSAGPSRGRGRAFFFFPWEKVSERRGPNRSAKVLKDAFCRDRSDAALGSVVAPSVRRRHAWRGC